MGTNELLQVLGGGGNAYDVRTIDVAMKERLRESLEQLGRDPSLFGLSEADVLIALGKERDMLSPFGLLMKIVGYALRYAGVNLGSLMILLCVGYTGKRVGEGLYGIVKRFFGAAVPVVARDAESGGTRLLDEGDFFNVTDFLTTLLPAPVERMLNKVVEQIGGGAASGGSPSSGSGNIRVSAAEPGDPIQGVINSLTALSDADFETAVASSVNSRAK